MMDNPVTVSALNYIERGFSLVRIPFRQKAPRERDWQKNAISTADAAERHLCGQMNIGVLLGTTSGGLVDVDLDCREACEFADNVLPPTASTFGRASKPRSHWLYYVDGPAPSLKFSDPLTGEVLLELRGDKRDGSTGYQTVFPPSIHPSGEAIEWVEDGEPAQVDYAELKRALTLLAISCLIKRYCPGVVGEAEAQIALDRTDPRLGNEVRRWKDSIAENVTARGNGQAAGFRPWNGTALTQAGSAAINIFDRPRRRPGRLTDLVAIDCSPLAWSEAGEARVRSALAVLPANDRNDWLQRGMELHSLGWGEPAHEIWTDWARTCPDKFDEPDQRKTWEGFNRRNPAEPRRTIASLFHAARERGWVDPDASLSKSAAPLSGDAQLVAAKSFLIFRADELLATAAPQRRWLVGQWAPMAEVTLAAGDGGSGKSTLALQLSLACVAGGDWFGQNIAAYNVLYVSAEDPRDEIHFRLEQINKYAQVPSDKLAGLKIIDLAGHSAVLATFDKGRIKPTALFQEIEQIAREHRAGCIILDAVADFFGGNENERAEVRAFIGMLRGLAMRVDAAIILIAHPSVDGIRTGRGYSGSTHWNNGVRSRWNFTAPETSTDEPSDPDLRVLELAKSNRARRGEKIHMRWWDGRFERTQPGWSGNPTNDQNAEEVFLQLLKKFDAEKLQVSNSRGPTYAPTEFVKRKVGKDIGKKALEGAMHRLLDRGVIRVEGHGPPSRRRHCLAIVETGKPPVAPS